MLPVISNALAIVLASMFLVLVVVVAFLAVEYYWNIGLPSLLGVVCGIILGTLASR